MDILGLISRSLRRVGREVKKESPKLLTIASIFGIGWTAYETAKATPAANEHLEEAKKKKKEITGDPQAELTLIEKAKTAGPDYAKAIAVGAGTAGCMATSTYISGQQLANMTMSAVMASKAMREQGAALRDVVGKEKVDAAQNDILTKKMLDNPPKNPAEIYDTGDGDDLFYYVRYGIWFRSSVDKVRAVQIDLNDEIDRFGGVSENDGPLRMLKLNPVIVGETYGFPKYEYDSDGQAKPAPRVEFKLTWYRDKEGNPNPNYELSYILNGEAAIALDYYPWCGPCVNWESYEDRRNLMD